MRKTLMNAAVAAALVAASFAAQAADGQFFLDGKVGQSQYHNDAVFSDRKDSSYNVLFGYRWNPEPRFWIGPEVGYVDLGKLSQHFSDITQYDDLEARTKVKASAFLVGANAKWDLGSHLYLTAHAGLSRTRTTLSQTISQRSGNYYESGTFNFTGTKTSWYSGLGFGYDISKSFGIGISYDIYRVRIDDSFRSDTNVTVAGINAEWRF